MNPTQHKHDVVFIGNTESVFLSRTKTELEKRGFNVGTISTTLKTSKYKTYPKLIRSIFLLAARAHHVYAATKTFPRNRTAVVHGLSTDFFWLVPLLKSHFHRVTAIAYGSDVIHRKKKQDFLLRIGLRKLDYIAATNYNIINILINEFSFIDRKHCRITRFGLPVFDSIEATSCTPQTEAKNILGFPPDKVIVSLGYAASTNQRQLELISFFKKEKQLHENIQFIVPVQYGSDVVKDIVIQACKQANKNLPSPIFLPVTEFYDTNKTALLRRATSILINHSLSDAFSGTVQEVLYAGGLILAAAHLPYDSMPGFGTSIRQYNELSETTELLNSDAIDEWTRTTSISKSETATKLKETSSWAAVYRDWEALIDGASR